jgi:putative peptide zinc metalloprotease protein
MRAYALATAAYRVVVAVAIAAAVFSFFGSIAGALVAALEVYILLLRPVLRELAVIRRQRAAIGSQLRAGVSLVVLTSLVGMLLLPLDRSIAVPALLTHERLQYVSAPFPGRVVQAPPAAGAVVEPGQPLLVIENPERLHEQARIELELRRNRALQQALDTRGAEGGYRRWLEEEQRRLVAARDRAASQLAQLVVTAREHGRIVERHPDYQLGDTVAADQVLATVLQSSRIRVHAYVQDLASARLRPQDVSAAQLRPWDLGLPALAVPVTAASVTAVDTLPSLALFDRYGGPVVSVAAGRSQGAERYQDPAGLTPLRPRDAYQALSFTVDLPRVAGRIPDGAPAWVELQLQPVSLAGQFIEFIARTLSR